MGPGGRDGQHPLIVSRWFARPEGTPRNLRTVPRLASWNKSDHPDQIRLREYVDDTEDLLGTSMLSEPWALRLDVGLHAGRDVLDMADLDNYAYPLASRLRDERLLSVWCRKQVNETSSVLVEPARELPPPTAILAARTTASAQSQAYKEQVRSAVAGAAEIAAGAVHLQISFTVSPRRNWLNLWKPTIDALDPLLWANPRRP